MYSALLLSGGGWHGAVQKPVIESLQSDSVHHNLIFGVSVGSVNGAALACDVFNSVAVPLWENLDDRHILDGIKGFLSPAILRGKGLFSLCPLEKLISSKIKTGMLKTTFGAGHVIRETGEYKTSLFWPTSVRPRLSMTGLQQMNFTDAIIASAAVAGVMEPVELGGSQTLCDGGHVHVLPRIPDEMLPTVSSIDAVFCKPISHWKNLPTSKVDNVVDAAVWAIEMQMESTRLADYEWLLLVKARFPNIKIRVFAPLSVHGGMLDAKRSDILARYKLGEYAASHPITL